MLAVPYAFRNSTAGLILTARRDGISIRKSREQSEWRRIAAAIMRTTSDPNLRPRPPTPTAAIMRKPSPADT